MTISVSKQVFFDIEGREHQTPTGVRTPSLALPAKAGLLRQTFYLSVSPIRPTGWWFRVPAVMDEASVFDGVRND